MAATTLKTSKAPNEKYSRSNSEEPSIYVVLSSEIPKFNQIRALAHNALLSNSPIWTRSSVYFEFFPTPAGLDAHIRSLLFPDSKRCRRGAKAPPIASKTGKLPRGRPPKGLKRSRHDIEVAEKARKESVRVIQRQNKQRGRCESRLLALFYSCMYDVTVRSSALTQGIPPLHKKVFVSGKMRHTRRGQDSANKAMTIAVRKKMKTVSNYYEVRAFLRTLLTNLISTQAGAIRTVIDMAAMQANVLPSSTITIARTFIASYSLLSDKRDVDGSYCAKHTDAGSSHSEEMCQRARAFRVLDECLDSIVSYVADWWRRNFTRDNDVPNDVCFKREDELVSASEQLLRVMIRIMPPCHPSQRSFRHRFIHSFGSLGAPVHDVKNCFTCKAESSYDGDDPRSLEEECHEYVRTLTSCSNLVSSIATEELDDTLTKESSSANSPLWKYIYSQVALHRLQAQSAALKNPKLKGKLSQELKNNSGVRTCVNVQTRSELVTLRVELLREFVQTVQWNVSRFWVALYASNEESLTFLRRFDLQNLDMLYELTVQSIYGGVVATEALLENNDEMVSITEHLLKLSTDPNSNDIEDEVQHSDENGEDPTGVPGTGMVNV